ncbi:FAD-binding oxidoreductase [Granulicella sp. L56]|uniref:NAD(P)/FAD-dependent oxidoreductase n=1 Tax=Granulicella sp. L56 TaxID=1747222 RepID=UPI00131CA7EF|nr:FAD-dependent oxidoreductase [Granulicella sp. L56]
MHHSDICIAGAGIIGLSLALELHRHGLSVTVFDQAQPLGEASTAAAGMLAASDPDNPAPLRKLADLSLSLYPAFLDRLHAHSGIAVPFHTSQTLQSQISSSPDPLSPEALSKILPQLTPQHHHFTLLDEHSLDPRNLAAALLAAVRATTIDLQPDTKVLSTQSIDDAVEVHTTQGIFHAAKFINCTGAWATHSTLAPSAAIAPRKGQMLAIAIPPTLSLPLVVRTHGMYIVPRTTGPNAGRAIIGATIEDAGFDKIVHPADIAHLRSLAAALLPALADAPQLEVWAGLRPSTPDELPFLGPSPGHRNQFVAAGHYRNGILLAPATAHVMAQSILGKPTAIDLSDYSPTRTLASSAIAH